MKARNRFQIFAIAVSMAVSLCDQTTPTPIFDAASVKLSSPLDAAAMMSRRARRGITIDAGRIDIANTPLFGVFAGAYRLKDYQLSGPDWMKTVRVDIVGTLLGGTSQDDIPEMLQSLLAERFRLKEW